MARHTNPKQGASAMEASDLTHAEAKKAFSEFRAEVSPSASISIGVNTGSYRWQASLYATVWPEGVGNLKGESFGAEGDTYAELLTAIKAKWAERADAAASKTIREMALRIISITADEGCCCELSLCKAFSPAEVKAYGDRACEEATRIGGNGPFSILRAASEAEAA